MHKYIIAVLFTLSYILSSVFAYDNFDKNYNYSEIASNSNINLSNSNEEILFIVDYSSSMNSTLQGKSYIRLALDAVKDVLATASASTKIGLRVFGVTDRTVVYRQGNTYKYDVQKLCEASTLIMPISSYNQLNIVDRLEQTKPWGVTPIKYSLMQAIQNDFSNNPKVMKHIILVTDGAENCNQDPCSYIKDLMNVRDDLKIDVIGIRINENDFSQLSCIAREGKGKFFPIESPDDFKIRFRQAINFVPKSSSYMPETSINTSDEDKKIIYKNFVYQFDN